MAVLQASGEQGAHAPARRPSDKARKWRLSVAAFGAALLLIVNGVIAWNVAQQHRQAVDDTARYLTNVARALAEYTAQAMGRVDQMLASAAEDVEALSEDDGERAGAVAELLARHLARIPHVHALVVANDKGTATYGSSGGLPFVVPLAEWPALDIAPPYTIAGAYIGAPLVRDGNALIPVSRRIAASNAPNEVAIVALVDPRYFTSLYTALDVGPDGTVSLRTSGTALMLARAPRNDRLLGRSFAGNILRPGLDSAQQGGVGGGASPVDGIKRMIGWRRVPGWPLVVTVAMSERDFLAPWQRGLREQLGLALIVSLVIIGCTLALARQLRRQHAAHAALEESERRFRDFALAASDWFWEQDANLRFTYASTARQMAGADSRHDLLGKAAREVSPQGASDEQWTRHEAELAAHKPFRDFRLQAVDPKGRVRHLSVNGVPVFAGDGRFSGYRGTTTDITALVEADSALRTVIDAIPAMVSAKDRDSRYVFMNAYQAQLYATTPEAAVGKTAADLLGKEYGAYTHGVDRQVIATGEPVPFFEERYATADGTERDWLTTKVPILDAHGRAQRVVTVALDNTNRKETERRLIRMQRDLRTAVESAENASRAKSAFLANMSHELRTPLNAILGFSEVMEREMMGPIGSRKYRDYAADIRRSGTMLLQLVNDVLDMSKIEAGKRALSREPFAPEALIEDCLRLVRGQAEKRGVALAGEIPGGLPPLTADRRAIEQVLTNLLTNAVKFTPPGGTVQVTARREPRAFVMSVRDTGAGMPAELIARIGQPFLQADTALTRRYEGSGLGLALAKSLVDMHGGSMIVDSKEDEGTTVTVILPQEQIQQSAA